MFFKGNNKLANNNDGLKKLKRLAQNIKDFEGINSIPMGDVLTDEFIQANTNFQNIEELFEKAGYKVENQADFQAIPQEDIDSFVRENSKFDSFTTLQQEAVDEFVRNKIFKGVK